MKKNTHYISGEWTPELIDEIKYDESNNLVCSQN